MSPVAKTPVAIDQIQLDLIRLESTSLIPKWQIKLLLVHIIQLISDLKIHSVKNK